MTPIPTPINSKDSPMNSFIFKIILRFIKLEPKRPLSLERKKNREKFLNQYDLMNKILVAQGNKGQPHLTLPCSCRNTILKWGQKLDNPLVSSGKKLSRYLLSLRSLCFSGGMRRPVQSFGVHGSYGESTLSAILVLFSSRASTSTFKGWAGLVIEKALFARDGRAFVKTSTPSKQGL